MKSAAWEAWPKEEYSEEMNESQRKWQEERVAECEEAWAKVELLTKEVKKQPMNSENHWKLEAAKKIAEKLSKELEDPNWNFAV